MDTATKKEFENLAGMVKRGFDAVDKRFDATASKEEMRQLAGEVQHIKGEVQHINATLGVMATDVADIKKHFVYRNEFEDLIARVKYLELKLGVESGK
ncbi:MAG: hypothetical protein Q8Q46_02185 [Candidatus Giovannonibacteria bacterium]|nr:hypothetical protein [Candidatus Giovannonibacteria bacterium]